MQNTGSATPWAPSQQLSTILQSLGYTPSGPSTGRWESRFNLRDDHLVHYIDSWETAHPPGIVSNHSTGWVKVFELTKWATVPSHIFYNQEDKISFGKLIIKRDPVISEPDANSLREWVLNSWNETLRNPASSWYNVFKMLDSRRETGKPFSLEDTIEEGQTFQIKVPENAMIPREKAQLDGRVVKIVNYKEVLPKIKGRPWEAQTVVPFVSLKPSIPSVYLRDIVSQEHYCLTVDWLIPASVCQCSSKDLLMVGCHCGVPK